MPEVYESTVTAAPAGDVRETLRDFGGLDAWYPGIAPGDLRMNSENTGATVGAIPTIDMSEGVTVRDQLIEHSDDRRSCTYAILDYPLPLENYHGTLRVQPVTDRGASSAAGSSRFEVEPALREDAVENITAVYRTGLEALVERFD